MHRLSAAPWYNSTQRLDERIFYTAYVVHTGTVCARTCHRIPGTFSKLVFVLQPPTTREIVPQGQQDDLRAIKYCHFFSTSTSMDQNVHHHNCIHTLDILV